ncbi:MAG: hypothetical protein WCH98_15190 [Verrucomicrobiota bacterium]
MTGRQSGFSLVEVTLALGIAAFCLLVVVALLPAGILSIRDSAEATASLSFSQAVLADLRATGASTNATNSARFQVSIPPAGTAAPATNTLFFSAGGVTNSAAAARYRMTVTLTPPTNSASRQGTLVHIRTTWPAAAAVTNAPGAIETFGVLDRNN